MKKLITLLGLLALPFMAAEAQAKTQAFDGTHSSATVKGVTVTTGTVVQMDADRTATMAGFREAPMRLTNDGTDKVYCGYTSAVATTGDKKGVSVSGGSSATFPVNNSVSLYCIAESGAGAGGVEVSLEYFGYGGGN